MTAHRIDKSSKLLNEAQQAINNTLWNSEIQSLVAVYGYTAARMEEVKHLHSAATDAVNAHSAAVRAGREATEQTHAAEQAARASYQALAQISRALFNQNSPQRTALGLLGNTPRSTNKFLAAAKTLFDNALNVVEIAAVLSEYGYPPERVEAERSRIDAFVQATQAQAAAISATRVTSHEQHVALNALDRWLAQYRAIAKIALKSKPRLIEKLNPAARAARIAAQRAAAKKPATGSAKRVAKG